MCGFSCKNGLLDGAGRAEKLLGRAVISLAGHDAGKIYFIVGVQSAGERNEKLLLADGKKRGLANPKAKKLKHVRLLPYVSVPVAEAAKGKRADNAVVIHEMRKFSLKMCEERFPDNRDDDRDENQEEKEE